MHIPVHIPVQGREIVEHMALRPDGRYLDVTAGLGGHLGLIAQRLVSGVVIGNDRDAESLEMAKARTAQWADRIRYHHGPFSKLQSALQAAGVDRVDGLLADLGVSRYQLTEGQRGFSIQSSGPLDMRMDRSQEQTAADIVNFTAEKELADLIFRLG